jgi:hypothetical protein
MITEVWKDVVGFPDYAVSNLGRVKRLTAQKGTWPGKILKARMNGRRNGNYYFVSIPNESGEYFGKAVARLVAQAFIPNPKNKPEVNHLDGEKANNAVYNLEWSTHQENSTHAKQNGLMARGSQSGTSRLTEKDIPLIRRRRANGKTYQSICDEFGVSNTCVRDIIIGRTWKHLIWT